MTEDTKKISAAGVAAIIIAVIIGGVLWVSYARQKDAKTNLQNKTWQLEKIDEAEVLTDTTVTVEFKDDNTLSGTGGCNMYNGTYKLNWNKIEISPLATTLMMCEPAISAQETLYLGLLESAATYEAKEDCLKLYDEAGKLILEFKYLKPLSLPDTKWSATGYNNGKGGVTSLIKGTKIAAVFGTDDILSGNAGCNDYTAPYKTDEAKIEISKATVAKKVCKKTEGIMEQESLYIKALQMADVFNIELDKLELRTAKGSLVASFEAMEE